MKTYIDSTTLIVGGNLGSCCTTIDRKEYERQLAETQRKHLEAIQNRQEENWRPCLHDQCPQCHGTGITAYGHPCVHGISCPCPKCTPTY